MASTAFPSRDDFAALLNDSLGGEDGGFEGRVVKGTVTGIENDMALIRSEEHTSELQSLMRVSYAVFCLKKKNNNHQNNTNTNNKHDKVLATTYIYYYTV